MLRETQHRYCCCRYAGALSRRRSPMWVANWAAICWFVASRMSCQDRGDQVAFFHDVFHGCENGTRELVAERETPGPPDGLAWAWQHWGPFCRGAPAAEGQQQLTVLDNAASKSHTDLPPCTEAQASIDARMGFQSIHSPHHQPIISARRVVISQQGTHRRAGTHTGLTKQQATAAQAPANYLA